MSSVYEPLPDPSRHIRLFTVNGEAKAKGRLVLTLTTHRVTTATPSVQEDLSRAIYRASRLKALEYTALSYLWGLAVEASPRAIVNGKSFVLRENLFQFLIHLNESESTQPIWADDICINQENESERNQQVAMMGPIFGCASRVISWLVPHDLNSQRVFNLAAVYTAQGKTAEDVLSQELKRSNASFTLHEIEAMYNFGSCRYWWRTWIVQELVLAQHRTIACGSQRIPLAQLQELLALAHQRVVIDGHQPSIHRQLGIPSTYAANLMKLILETFPLYTMTSSGQRPLRELLHYHGRSGRSDPRDKVYALRSLASDVLDSDLRPNYSIDLHDLFWEVLAVCGTGVSSNGLDFYMELLQLFSLTSLSLLAHAEKECGLKMYGRSLINSPNQPYGKVDKLDITTVSGVLQSTNSSITSRCSSTPYESCPREFTYAPYNEQGCTFAPAGENDEVVRIPGCGFLAIIVPGRHQAGPRNRGRWALLETSYNSRIRLLERLNSVCGDLRYIEMLTECYTRRSRTASYQSR